MRAKRRCRSKQFQSYKMLGHHHDPLLLLLFFFDHLAEHAFPVLVVMAESPLQPLAHLIGDDGRGYQLRVRMLQARPRIFSMIFKDRDLGNPRIMAERIVTRLVCSQNARHVLLRQ